MLLLPRLLLRYYLMLAYFYVAHCTIAPAFQRFNKPLTTTTQRKIYPAIFGSSCYFPSTLTDFRILGGWLARSPPPRRVLFLPSISITL